MGIPVLVVVPVVIVLMLLGTVVLYFHLSNKHNKEKSKYALPTNNFEAVSSESVSQAVQAVNSSPIMTRSPIRSQSPRSMSPVTERHSLNSPRGSPIRDYGASPLRQRSELGGVAQPQPSVVNIEQYTDEEYIPHQEERVKQVEDAIQARNALHTPVASANESDISSKENLDEGEAHNISTKGENGVETDEDSCANVTPERVEGSSLSDKMSYSSSSGKENFYTPSTSFPTGSRFGSMTKLLSVEVGNSRRSSDAFSERFFTPDQYPSYLGTFEERKVLSSSFKDNFVTNSPKLNGISEESPDLHKNCNITEEKASEHSPKRLQF
eukprot:Nk52_evm6s352 gene=Nk52_evmTU6s352